MITNNDDLLELLTERLLGGARSRNLVIELVNINRLSPDTAEDLVNLARMRAMDMISEYEVVD